MTEIKESQHPTKAIRNAGKVLNMSIVSINKICNKLKGGVALRIAKPLAFYKCAPTV